MTKLAAGLVLGAVFSLWPEAVVGQVPGSVRDVIEGLEFEPSVFEAPEPELKTLEGGIRVLFLEDRTLPLVNVMAYFRGGYSYFPRSDYAAALGLSAMIRNGGTRSAPPDSIDALMEFHAVQTVFGSSGRSLTSSMNALTDQLPIGLELWGEILREPGFDTDRVETWRSQELDAVRRRMDDPTRLAYSEFNRLMYGDHPIGWEMNPDDLTADRVNPDRLRALHSMIMCPENLILGVTGAVAWSELEPMLNEWVDGWASCPAPLGDPPQASIRQEPGVFLIPRPSSQSTVVMAHTSDVHLSEDGSYFESRVGNSILGGSGLRSRIMAKLRTQEGLAYSGSSLWTAPRTGQGLFGVITQTKGESTVAAIRLLLETVSDTHVSPPSAEEVDTTIDEYVNGFVFNFSTPSQIVSRQMVYLAEDFPEDWLDKYLQGLQAVSAEDVLGTFRTYVRPDDLVILVVGDPALFDRPLESLERGPVTILDPRR